MQNKKFFSCSRSKQTGKSPDQQAKEDFATAVKTFGLENLKRDEPGYYNDHIKEYENSKRRKSY